MRLIAYRNDPWICIRDTTRFVFDFRYIVDYVFFRFVVECARFVDRTDDVDLIEFEGQISLVDVDNVVRVVNPEAKHDIKRTHIKYIL